MALRQSTEEFCERMSNVCDDLYVAIEAKNTADQHTALAALIGLVEMLRSEIEHGDDEKED